MLGWYHHSEPHNDGPRILFSDVCQGEPSTEEIVKVVSHEYLHHVLDVLVSKHASRGIDSLVDDGNFIIERPENGVKDDRPMKEKW